MNDQLKSKLKKLPSAPGVYFHKSASGEVIYVGKAAVLKNRVRQYFQSRRDMDAKTLALVEEIADTDWTTTESEIDALFLESEMIKRYKPRYNILLRDDKSQTYVRINLRAELPFVGFTRQPADDGAQYIGPFYSGRSLKKALRILRKVFPYYDRPELPKKAGLNYQIGLTPGLEAGQSTLEDYKKSLRQLISYLKGNRVAVIKEIEVAMKAAAGSQKFEAAAKFRNQLYNLSELKKQVVFGREEFLDISRDEGLIGLRDLLNLERIPRRIEAYDISHHSGTNNTASMVVMTNGVANKAEYRKFLLRIIRNNDTAQLRETVQRRLKHLKDWGKPDLVVLDGGKGQISAVADLLKAAEIPVLGRSKGGDHSRNAAVTVVWPAQTGYQIVNLDSGSHVAKLIARLDDEAHRFAVSYHTSLKRAGQTRNQLEEIAGIGPKTRQKLLRHFGSIAKVKNAKKAEIVAVIGKSKANLLK
ncbi:MAG: excinuclease ABC subunit UvrC [Candidatus Nomurabacteria bacterium]|jgi:excinuclease ABC subunit C|nr:excinuclease ABC subunit UvrC [Candidatus Nomurabacteria bacterium]